MKWKESQAILFAHYEYIKRLEVRNWVLFKVKSMYQRPGQLDKTGDPFTSYVVRNLTIGQNSNPYNGMNQTLLYPHPLVTSSSYTQNAIFTHKVRLIHLICKRDGFPFITS